MRKDGVWIMAHVFGVGKNFLVGFVDVYGRIRFVLLGWVRAYGALHIVITINQCPGVPTIDDCLDFTTQFII